MKTIEHQFKDWNQYYIGYGYGTGEEHTLRALKTFLEATDKGNMYDFRNLEIAVTPTVAWLLINILCDADIIEYGTSPRTGWLSVAGRELKTFVSKYSAAQLYTICCAGFGELYIYCCPEFCNCGFDGDTTYKGPCIKGNVFWSKQ